MRLDTRTDATKLIVAFWNFSKAHKNNQYLWLKIILSMSSQSRRLHIRPSSKKVPLNSKWLPTIIVIIGAELHQGFSKILWFSPKTISSSWIRFRLSSSPKVWDSFSQAEHYKGHLVASPDFVLGFCIHVTKVRTDCAHFFI